jgi:DNA-binding protein HU-beta
MNKADLIDIIASDVDITKIQADATINAFTSAVISTLRKGYTVTLVGFGTFMVSNRAARNG